MKRGTVHMYSCKYEEGEKSKIHFGERRHKCRHCRFFQKKICRTVPTEMSAFEKENETKFLGDTFLNYHKVKTISMKRSTSC